MSTNVCLCTVAAATTTSIPCSDCVIAPSLVTDCTTSTAPCGASGSVDLTTYNEYGGCVDTAGDPCTLTYTVQSFDSTALVNVAIDANGLLTWDTTNDAVGGEFADVQYIVQCDCNMLSALAIVSICIRNLCPQNLCDTDEVCDPCTGTCSPFVDVEVT